MPLTTAHLTSAHSWSDVRIFRKECRSLAVAGYDVWLVAPDAPDETREGVHLRSIGMRSNGPDLLTGSRLRRMGPGTAAVFRAAQTIPADVYHLHDPELIPFGLALKSLGARVIYDAHEDLPRQMQAKAWLRPRLRSAGAWTSQYLIAAAAQWLDGVIAATPTIASTFADRAHQIAIVRNYPIASELLGVRRVVPHSELAVAYVGAISRVRGLCELVEALPIADAYLNLAGRIDPGTTLWEDLQRLPGWPRVRAVGQLGRPAVRNLLARSTLGAVPLYPLPNYLDALPTKLFEYMAAGLPVLASDFPAWRRLVEGGGYGLCIDPLDPASIGTGIRWLGDHPEEARAMGARGRTAIAERFNWAREEESLLSFYASLR